MSELMMAEMTWRMTNVPEARRREADEVAGRLVANWSRGLRRTRGRRG
jgi:hypothetical protein